MPAFTQFNRGNPFGESYEGGLARARAEEIQQQQILENEARIAERSALSNFVADMTAPQPVVAAPAQPIAPGTEAAVRPEDGTAAQTSAPAIIGPTRERRMSAIRRIATENPMAGGTAYKLYAGEQDRQNRVADKVYEMLKSNAPDQISYARVMAQQHGISIPDEIFVNAQSRARFVGMIETGKSMGYTPQQFASFLAETAKHGSMGQDIQAGAAAAGKIPGGRYSGYRSGAAGGGSARVQHDEYRKKELIRLGMSEHDAIRVIQLKGAVGGNERTRIVNNLMKSTDAAGMPLYKSPNDAMKAADNMIRWAQQTGATEAQTTDAVPQDFEETKELSGKRYGRIGSDWFEID